MYTHTLKLPFIIWNQIAEKTNGYMVSNVIKDKMI